MEIRHLKYFLKVAEERNFSRAAEKLFISQPPLSRQIKELENEIKATLFNRNNRKVELTDAGAYFEGEVRQILSALERATLKTRKISDHISGEFRIGYIGSTFSGIITDLTQYLSENYPYAKFKLFEISTTKQIQGLEKGELDLSILRAPLDSTLIETRLWFRDSYSLVYNKNLFKVDSDKEIEALKDATFVFYNKEFAPEYHKSLIQICAAYGFKPNLVHESNNINSIIQLVRNGLGVSIVPGSLEKNHPNDDLTFLNIKRIKLYTEVLLATPRNQQSEIADKAIKFLQAAVS